MSVCLSVHVFARNLFTLTYKVQILSLDRHKVTKLSLRVAHTSMTSHAPEDELGQNVGLRNFAIF